MKAFFPEAAAFIMFVALLFGIIALIFTLSVPYFVEDTVEQTFPLGLAGTVGAVAEVGGSVGELAAISLGG